MNLDKIRDLSKTPRTLTKEHEKICSRPFFFLRKAVREWEQEMTHGPVVLGAVVQAHECLYDKEEAQFAKGVMMWTVDSARSQDKAWLQSVAERLVACREKAETLDERHVANLLNDEESSIEGVVPKSLTDGVEVRWVSQYIDPDDLPGGCVPQDKLFAAIIMGGDLRMIPPALYN